MSSPTTTLHAWLLGSVISLAPISLVPTVARAEPLPADLSLGGGARIAAVVVDGRTRIDLVTGTGPAESWELATELSEITIEAQTSAGRPLTVVRGRGRGIEIAGIVDRRPRARWLWRGRLDLRGDPGERVADALERRDIDADGRPDLVVGQRREGVGPCGEPPQLLFARALDARGALRPVQPVLDLAGVSSLTAEGIGAAHTTPTVRGARFTAASSQLGGPEDALGLGPPLGLTDERAETAWAEGRGEAGVGEVLRGQWSGPAIAALELRGGPGAALPRRFVLGLDASRWVVTVPAEHGEAARITLPAPVQASCLSLVLADAEPRGAEAHVGFAEIAVYSVADGPQGLDALVDILVADAADGDRAVGWLASAGPRAVDALAAAWERLGARGRRRALRAVATIETGAEAEVQAAIRSLRARAAADGDADVRGDAIAALARGEDVDRSALFDVARSSSPAGDAAATALARAGGPPTSTWDAVLALDASSWDRPSLRAAIAASYAREPAWRDRPGLLGYALASLALGLADRDDPGELVTPLLEQVVASETAGSLGFATRFRVARAARSARSTALDVWLDGVARTAEEWMLRAEAVEALGERASRELLALLLHDPYPRVRLSAARAVARRGGEHPTLIALARHDGWPLVRGYALGEVADLPEARELLVEALADPASAMRARSLELLRTRRGQDMTPGVLAILQDAREWPHVTSRAIELVEASCDATFGPGLVTIVRRGARTDASAASLDSAQLALRVALRIGGPTAEAARAAASAGPSATTFSVLLSHPQEPCGGQGPGRPETTAEGPVSQGVPSAP